LIFASSIFAVFLVLPVIGKIFTFFDSLLSQLNWLVLRNVVIWPKMYRRKW